LPPRNTKQRIADVLEKLRHDEDVWVASASETGEAYLIPLSFYWEGTRVILATLKNSRTVRNLQRAGWARLALGPTRDVVILEGGVTIQSVGNLDPALAAAFTEKAGFDPWRQAEKYVYLLVTPERVQAWREANELSGRQVMRDGIWLEA
jgi:hypothetical protein